jgi:glutamate synthase domain-containing protein 3
MVELEDVVHEADVQILKELIEKHAQYTGSPKAKRILEAWEAYLPRFVKVMPNEYRLALERLKEKAVSEQAAKDELALAAGGT